MRSLAPFSTVSHPLFSHKGSLPVKADERGEVWRLEEVDDLDEFRAVDCIRSGEDAAWEYAELQERRYRLVLGQLGVAREEPRVLLLLQSVKYN